MPKKLTNFQAMWDAYPAPNATAAEAKRIIGGGADVEWIKNTCIIRLSRCLNYADHALPRNSKDELLTVTGRDGMQYGLRVQEMRRFLKRVYGSPLSHRYSKMGGPVPESFQGQKGIICFLVPDWNDATGHFDLWDGKDCRHARYFSKAKKVELWPVAGRAAPKLSASVGRRGANRKADVRKVQRLLVGHGFNPGPVDGAIGRKTVSAITAFQKRFLRQADGRVDPGGRTWNELNGL